MDPAINFPVSGTSPSPTRAADPDRNGEHGGNHVDAVAALENNIPLALRPQNYELFPKDLSLLVRRKEAGSYDAP
jgi:hypothetical protein